MVDWTTPVISFCAAVAGGFLVHFLSLSRDRSTKRRELVTKHLIEIWNLIYENNVAPPEGFGNSQKSSEYLEQVVRDIQVFGTKEQISLVQKTLSRTNGTDDVNIPAGPDEVRITPSGPPISIDALTREVQLSIRRELGLDLDVPRFFWVKFQRPPSKINQTE